MDMKKVIAVLVVAIVVAAGVAVLIVNNGNGKDNRQYGEMQLLDSNIKATLGVYGNVNGDAIIDEKDKKALQDAIAAGTTGQLCKYADANYDGKIDADDVTKIEEILAATPASPVTVKHVQRYRTGDYESESKYPCDKILTAGAGNMLQAMKQIGVCSQIVGISWSSKVDPTLFPEYQFLFNDKDKYQVGTSAGNIAADKLNVVKDETGVRTLIYSDDTSYLGDSKKSMTEDQIESKGVDVIRIAPATSDFSVLVSDLALVSFFLQNGANLNGLVGWYSSTISNLNDVLIKNVGEGKAYHVISFANSSYSTFSKGSDGTIKTSDAISGATSDYTAFGRAAGGFYALEDAPSVAKQENGGAWLSDYTIDKIIVTATGSSFSWYGGTALTTGKDAVSERIKAYYNSEPYYNGEVYVMSGDMPSIMRIVYAAHIYYPELFSKTWADSVNLQFCTQYLGLSPEQVSKGQFYFSMSDLGIDPKVSP